MKKAGCLLILTAMILFIVCAQAELAEDFFRQFDGMEWCFSSGAGGWSTDLRILPDGSFSGEYHDSEMGESAEAYPDGTVYYCNFTGRLSMTGQVDQDTWKIRVESLAETPVQEKETIADGLRLVYSEPYGISEGDEMLLYQPGTPLDRFTDEMKLWAHLFDNPEEEPVVLQSWFLYSGRNDSGFVSLP